MERNITNDLVTEYINGFYTPISAELECLRTKAEQDKIPIILKETESFLNVLLKIMTPKRILEIGCAVGYSAVFFSSCCGAEVVTIERDHDMTVAARNNIKKMGLEKKIRIEEGDGQECIKQLVRAGEAAFDMVFIDAAKSHYKRFLEASMGLCSKGAVIVSDNVLLKGKTASDIYDPTGKHKTNIKRMREYVEFITKDPHMDTTIISCGDGLAISKLK